MLYGSVSLPKAGQRQDFAAGGNDSGRLRRRGGMSEPMTMGSTTIDPEDDRRPTAEEASEFRRRSALMDPDEVDPDLYPRLGNISAGHIMRAIVRPIQAEPLEYVTIDLRGNSLDREEDVRELVAVAKWNTVWESAQFRRLYFDENELSEQMRRIADVGDVNAYLVPRTRTRYYEYAPLFHLLSAATLDKFGLPLLRGGLWPYTAHYFDIDDFLPVDFESRLGRAWAWMVWRHLDSGSKMSAFKADEPLRLLAHNLDYWVPAVTTVIQERLGSFPEVSTGVELGPVPLTDGSYLEGAYAGYPRMGGDVWTGEGAARQAIEETVEAADATGHLRDIIDAIRSNRVVDDFSDTWSYAREDFERRLYSKRSKVRVRFVELRDTIPVQGPESQIVGNLVTNDFLATLDPRNREIVVLLSSGFSNKTEIARRLGYAGHSAVSKRLNQIRRQAAEFFGLD